MKKQTTVVKKINVGFKHAKDEHVYKEPIKNYVFRHKSFHYFIIIKCKNTVGLSIKKTMVIDAPMYT